jgi:5,6-dimethylbenzimidazole synthase
LGGRGEEKMTESTREYDVLLEILTNRMSVRRFKPDPVPDDHIERILEAGRWAMSGANSQPWEFIVVKDPETRQRLYQAYRDINSEYIFWMEQMRVPEMRHPSYQIPGEVAQQLEQASQRKGWGDAPVLICVVGDGRKQWGTVMGAMTFGRDMTHLTDGLANASQNMQLAAAALGLGAQWVTIHVQEPFKRILGVPDLLTFYLIIPIGYPAVERRPGYRRELRELVHNDKYDMNKYLSNADAIEYIRQLRQRTLPKYASSYGAARP